ncbi:PREDICTED: mannose-6-phosphate isomerase-like isoform X1 [Acropora digitifera]|uniref:mannose-6-phosphate isomerase-like isoform X1 n=2 Tax=Acropora digitifera TaxID=70779 RepID=UPI00077A6E47|nr:PREDICTED: mannose-6-phosphate isomerase-like isoform X1 [Acropora digitifera]
MASLAGYDSEVVELKCAVQSYAWGKIGLDSTVAQLSQHSPSFELEEDKPYAELWMGTHINGPSKLLCGNKEVLLAEWIDKNTFVLGATVKEAFDGKLPFLFKVLSVNKALSIQAHPSKSQAKQLHMERPDVYTDSNHKPEVIIALTTFESLCGFRPLAEIKKYIKTIPELALIIGKEAEDAITSGSDSEALKTAFSALMRSKPDIVSKHLHNLEDRILEMKRLEMDISSICGDLLLRLTSQFPEDVGCLCIYFLNYITLKPGEAMFLGSNLPHAYLAGDCMECMACSDNVVRAGLTPKLKDVDTLCEMLDYRCRTKEEIIFSCTQSPNNPFVTVYDPPVPDFTIARIQIPSSCSSYTFQALNGPSIAIMICGSGGINISSTRIALGRGTVVFISANTTFDFNNCDRVDCEIYQAYCVL